MRITLKAINSAIEGSGISAELVKGCGYYYFTGADVDCAYEQGVYGVRLLSDLTVEQWVGIAKEKAKKG